MEEAFLGVCCIAAPVRNFQEDTIAAISVTLPTIRMTREKKSELTKLLQETAAAISGEF